MVSALGVGILRRCAGGVNAKKFARVVDMYMVIKLDGTRYGKIGAVPVLVERLSPEGAGPVFWPLIGLP